MPLFITGYPTVVFFVLLAGEEHYFGRNTWLWFTLVEFIAIAWQTVVLTMWMKQPAPNRVCPSPVPNEGRVERVRRMSIAAGLTLVMGPPVTPDTAPVRLPATLMSAGPETDPDDDSSTEGSDSEEEPTPTITAPSSLEARHDIRASSTGKLMLPPISHPNK